MAEPIPFPIARRPPPDHDATISGPARPRHRHRTGATTDLRSDLRASVDQESRPAAVPPIPPLRSSRGAGDQFDLADVYAQRHVERNDSGGFWKDCAAFGAVVALVLAVDAWAPIIAALRP